MIIEEAVPAAGPQGSHHVDQVSSQASANDEQAATQEMSDTSCGPTPTFPVARPVQARAVQVDEGRDAQNGDAGRRDEGIEVRIGMPI